MVTIVKYVEINISSSCFSNHSIFPVLTSYKNEFPLWLVAGICFFFSKKHHKRD